MKTIRPLALGACIALSLTLAACGGSDDPSDPKTAPESSGQMTQAPLPDLAEVGPGHCYELLADEIGADAKIHNVYSAFFAGVDLAPDQRFPFDPIPQGAMNTCSVEYQDPDDPKKLLSLNMSGISGEFEEPVPLEISVSGDAATFDLEDYLIPLSEVNTDGLQALMDEQQGRLEGAYSDYAWTRVDLSGPDTFNPEHEFRVALAGRVKSNDVLDTGAMTLKPDGSVISLDDLTP